MPIGVTGGVALGGAVLGAGASIYGSTQAAGAADKAANLNQNNVNFNNLRDAPYVALGNDAASLLQQQNDTNFGLSSGPNYLSLADANIPNANNMADLVNTPGYQFNLTQGLQATQNAAAAKGLGVSGAALKGAASYATGLADSTYQNQFANQQQKMTDYLNLNTTQQANATNLYNRLAGTTTIGSNTAVGAGSSGVAGTNAAGNALISSGTATAAGTAGAGSALTGAANNYLTYSALQNLAAKGNATTAAVGGAGP